ncbi:alpha/beta hydrolase [Crossiella cryophila]|uniref:Alpha-beta hydrolase superfamily lysophospholipase n=1 Tax=Crossiella cryophila TaxID=43355 RepID=A0A7W7CA72_9PSEU|nr:alpha/beta fold hydrolase [Crossiella cryophila]MBB4677396.1 alpha-beta hydrolase superfamily lysophospholipase [Crossiella cryophila]
MNRGTLVVLPGRGEHADRYSRLTARLAVDGYQVRVVDLPEPEPSLALARVHTLAKATEGPLYLLGADTGALLALHVARFEPAVRAVIAAGVPGGALPADGETLDFDDELKLRLHSADQRTELAADEGLRRGELLRKPVPPALAEAALAGGPDLPVLVLHGDSDVLCPPLTARTLALRLRQSRFVTVAESRHDVLHDSHHRSVAAQIVQLLEQTRTSRYSTPALRVSIRSTF